MTRANDFQCEAIAIMSFILDITRVHYSPLIAVFDKVIFNLIQAAVISFNIIAIYEI